MKQTTAKTLPDFTATIGGYEFDVSADAKAYYCAIERLLSEARVDVDHATKSAYEYGIMISSEPFTLRISPGDTSSGGRTKIRVEEA